MNLGLFDFMSPFRLTEKWRPEFLGDSFSPSFSPSFQPSCSIILTIMFHHFNHHFNHHVPSLTIINHHFHHHVHHLQRVFRFQLLQRIHLGIRRWSTRHDDLTLITKFDRRLGVEGIFFEARLGFVFSTPGKKWWKNSMVNKWWVNKWWVNKWWLINDG